MRQWKGKNKLRRAADLAAEHASHQGRAHLAAPDETNLDPGWERRSSSRQRDNSGGHRGRVSLNGVVGLSTAQRSQRDRPSFIRRRLSDLKNFPQPELQMKFRRRACPLTAKFNLKTQAPEQNQTQGKGPQLRQVNPVRDEIRDPKNWLSV